MTQTDRFFAKVNKTDSCWLWTGCRTAGKYGYFSLGKLMPAHRASWLIHNGPIPEGQCVCHRCDNPICVNPAHLFLGTHKTNAEDRNGKRREARGERHGLAKLTEEDVRQIRALVDPNRYHNGSSTVARQFGIDRLTVNAIVHRKTWTHI
jgi:hypothetical protein